MDYIPVIQPMWTQISSSEAALGRRRRIITATALNLLLGLGIWYGLFLLFAFFGVMPKSSVSGYVGLAVGVLILPAAWFDSLRKQNNARNTLVCNGCNIVKSADGQLSCKCGGTFHPMDEMKWVEPSRRRRRLSA
jgi:hypothetical protein